MTPDEIRKLHELLKAKSDKFSTPDEIRGKLQDSLDIEQVALLAELVIAVKENTKATEALHHIMDGKSTFERMFGSRFR